MNWNKRYGCVIRIVAGIAALVILLAGGAAVATLTVDDSGGANYSRIQDAIDNASAGDTILVYSGTYYENVDVNKQLTLRGIGMPVVNAGGSGSTITLNAGNNTLEGFSTTNSKYLYPNAGIKVNSNNNIIKNNTVLNNYYGINLDNSNNNMLSGNNASSNAIGIGLLYSSINILSDNNAFNNSNGISLLYSSNDNTLSGNNASHNFYGIVLTESVNNNTYVSNNEYGIDLGKINSNNNALTGNFASNNNYGIFLYYSSYNTLSGNNASYNNYGIGSAYSNNNWLKDNNVMYNNFGISMWDSNNNMLSGNAITSNNNYGIYLYYFYLPSFNNTIYNNYFSNTKNSYDNGNNIWSINKTSGTNIINGAFLGGNFWSDYAGKDTDGNGLGDTMLPYTSSGGITNGGDYLPLAYDVTPPLLPLPIIPNQTLTTGDSPVSLAIGDLNGDGSKDIVTADNLANQLSIFLQKVDHSFPGVANQILTMGIYPQSVAIGDLNDDGLNDIVTGDAKSINQISIFLQKANHIFSSIPDQMLTTENYPDSIAIGDLNNDELNDIAAVNGNSKISIFLQKSDNTFPTSVDQILNGGLNSNSIAIGDLDGDGLNDIIMAADEQLDQIHIFLQKDKHTFPTTADQILKIDATQTFYVAIDDLDGDGDNDFAVSSSDYSENTHQVSIFLQKSNHTFSIPADQELQTEELPVSVAIGDLNGDGLNDFATVVYKISGFGSVFMQNASHRFPTTPDKILATGDWPISIAIGDLNGNGFNDIATVEKSSNQVSIFLSGEIPAYGGVVVNLGQPILGRSNIWALTTGADGKIYGGTGEGGTLFVYDPINNISEPLGGVSGEDAVYSLATDEKGLIYGGTAWNSKFFVYDPLSRSIDYLGQPIANGGIISSLATKSNDIYGSTSDGGDRMYVDSHLFIYNSTTGIFMDLGQPIAGEMASKITLGKDGKIYGGTSPNGYIFTYDPETMAFTIIGQPVQGEGIASIIAGNDGKIYISLSGSLFSFDPEISSIDNLFEISSFIPVSGEFFWSLTEGMDGNIYGGTAPSGYLFKYNPSDYSISFIKPLATETRIRALTTGIDGKIYGGTGWGAYLFSYDSGYDVIVAGKGDCSGDGRVDIADALFIAQQTVGLRTLDPAQYAAADVSGDAKVDIVDALYIAQATVGLRIL